jgi:pimeloyl-ACP methyl ester carboxylesterase
MTDKPAIILVHGAWADGSCWNDIILRLSHKGYRVTAAQLPLTSLSDDIATIERTAARTSGPFVLVSHAYAGAPISGVRNERLKSLAFINSLAPDEGETVAGMFYRLEPHPLGPKLAPDENGLIWMPGQSFHQAFAPNATPDQITLMQATQQPLSPACIQEAMPAPAWKRVPSWYLVAEEDRMIHPETQAFMAGRMKATVQTHKVDHMPLITAPESVVRLIGEAAEAGG